MRPKTLTLLGALALVTAGIALAEEPAVKRRENKDRTEFPGTFVSVGAMLESLGADAQDTLYTKGALGLLAPDGTLWSFVDNAKGHGVITSSKLKGKEVRILGWKYPKTQFIEISKYQLKEGEKWVAYDYCKTCGWEPGDHKDTDLCEECAGEQEGK
ncbi:MAG: hypothetical protein IT460_16525 [Planctomycetes bacterium]|nr:hypothetical protein [Planctomycetota bacterium]